LRTGGGSQRARTRRCEMIYRGKWFTVRVEELAEVGVSTSQGNKGEVVRGLHVTHRSGTQNRTSYADEAELMRDYEGLAAAMEKVDDK